jgi:hypothetical protein
MGMNDDYGKKINQALKAVRQMHADVSKLLVDADGTIGKGKIAVFSNATRDLTVGVQAKTWMAWFVYRYYAAPDATEAGMVDAVTVWFFDHQSPIDEPLLLLGQIGYDLELGQQVRAVCQEFDLVYAFSSWSSRRALGEILTGAQPAQKQTVEWFKVIAVPLFSVNSTEDVTRLMEQVRNAQAPTATVDKPLQ